MNPTDLPRINDLTARLTTLEGISHTNVNAATVSLIVGNGARTFDISVSDALELHTTQVQAIKDELTALGVTLTAPEAPKAKQAAPKAT